mmetsp:Transcript_43517/g.70531  ORF Transcript_43517/g.70531 Transcript_43517/m.70531 type:complete len:237 (+) Transcript_43517:933-1643(+)
MPFDGRAGPKHRERQHALLHGVQQVAHSLCLCDGVHLGPQFISHEAPDGGPGQALDHGRSDVHLALVARPLFVKVLPHLCLEGLHIGAQAILLEPLPNEAKLAHSRGVVGVVEYLFPKDWNGERVHLGLVQVLIHCEKELLTLLAHQEDHILCQEVHLEDTSTFLVAERHQMQRVFQELDDRPEHRKAHGEHRRRISVLPPSADDQAGNHENGGPCWNNGCEFCVFDVHLHVDVSP